jgi:hypothetical protein
MAQHSGIAEIEKDTTATVADTLARETLAAVARFNQAFNDHDAAAVMAAMTDDCIFENTNPAPDGARYVGQEQVRAVWNKFFAENPDAHFEFIETIVAGDRCVVRWIYRKTKAGKPWHLCGVDLFRVRNGKIAEKLSFVKG